MLEIAGHNVIEYTEELDDVFFFFYVILVFYMLFDSPHIHFQHGRS